VRRGKPTNYSDRTCQNASMYGIEAAKLRLGKPHGKNKQWVLLSVALVGSLFSQPLHPYQASCPRHLCHISLAQCLTKFCSSILFVPRELVQLVQLTNDGLVCKYGSTVPTVPLILIVFFSIFPIKNCHFDVPHVQKSPGLIQKKTVTKPLGTALKLNL